MGLRKAAVAVLSALVLLVADSTGTVEAAQPVDNDVTLLEDARAVLLVGLAGTQLDTAARHHLENGGRGVILFSHNISSGN